MNGQKYNSLDRGSGVTVEQVEDASPEARRKKVNPHL